MMMMTWTVVRALPDAQVVITASYICDLELLLPVVAQTQPVD